MQLALGEDAEIIARLVEFVDRLGDRVGDVDDAVRDVISRWGS